MTSIEAMQRRLAKLEANPKLPVRFYTQQEREEAARLYEASLYKPDEPDPAHNAYIASRTLKEIQADYEAMLRGAPAPWL